MALLLALLIGGNNLLKILRDSVFLGHHSASELPYLYILVALIAGLVIVTYTKLTPAISILRLMLGTNAAILLAIVCFWIVLTYFDPGWSHYAFYIWSAMATVIAVAQAWTLANQIFTEEEGKKYFGVIAAGGTIGGIITSFGSRWSIHLSVESNHLLWAVAGIYLAAAMLVLFFGIRVPATFSGGERQPTRNAQIGYKRGIGELFAGSQYLKSMALIILVSVVVSTLIDFHFKTDAKQAYGSKQQLAGFFSLYYGWLSVATLLVQVVFTSRVLRRLGIGMSLQVTPGVLFAGVLALVISPGILTATLTRMADAVLRNSVHRSAMEIVYMALPSDIVKAAKTFLDVVVERLGDATAGFIILFFTLFSTRDYLSYIHIVCMAVIVVWFGLNGFLRAGFRRELPDQSVGQEMKLERTWLERETGE